MKEITSDGRAGKGALYGLIASTTLWFVLGGVFLTIGIPEIVILVTIVGTFIWGVTWSLAGAIISLAASRFGGLKIIGSICGSVVGVLSATLAIIWPRCDYGNVFDKVQWAIPVAVEMPVLFLLSSLNDVLEKTVNISLLRGKSFGYTLMVICSVLFWAAFGAILGKLIRRVPNLKLP